MIRFLKYATLVALIAVGIYYHYITFDPLSLVVLAAVLWTHLVGTSQRQQIADVIVKSNSLLLDNQKTIASKIETLRAEIKRLKS